jgi:LPS-assembly protein
VIFFADSGLLATSRMLRLSIIFSLCFVFEWFGTPLAAHAQGSLAGCHVYEQQNMTFRKVADEHENHFYLEGTTDAPVQIDCDEMQLFADHMESFQNEGRVIATGNVLYVSGGNRINAERLEFNTKTRTGTFYAATGTAVLRNQAEPGLFGTQEPDLLFRGDEIHKIGPKKYRLVRGNFTTCVQPTPRWEMQSRSITLNLDDYALLKNAIFRVKSVPVMYLPVFYYPIQEDDRATGFLIPTYGSTTARGQSISNAFFWAISRNQDATLYHDWFSKTGMGYGGEYRYVLGSGSSGNSRVSVLNEHETTFEQVGGTSSVYPGQRSYTIAGDMTQRLPFNLHARANVDYYSSIVSQQRYQQNIYDATRRTRRFGGNVAGNWGPYSLSATVDRNDYFEGTATYATTGSLPRVSFGRGERKIAGAPLYFGVNSEYVTLARSTTSNNVKTRDQGLSRVDVNPTLRIPFTRWPFLTFNSLVSWRGTYWTESLDRTVETVPQVPVGIGRRVFDVQTRITGPVFNRIWTTPDNGYAQKFKHVIEPTLSIQRTTAVDNFDRIVVLDGTDYIVGGTRLTYGVANRLFAKKETSREILSATVSQSYYTNQLAAQYDRNYQSNFNTSSAPTHYSPVALQFRGAPTDQFQGEFRTEWDPTAHTLRTLAANGSFSSSGWLQTSAGWSQRRFIPGLPNFDNEAGATNYVNASTNVRSTGGRVGGSYTFNYDLKRDTFLQQSFTVYLNSQCCGVAIEYQNFNYGGSLSAYGLQQDKRFNLSFTLAGIGTFSNLFGAFGGQRR